MKWEKGEISYDMAYMWTLKRNDTNELKDTHRLREWTNSGVAGWNDGRKG